MAGLLVSVRNVIEARAAVAGGAALIDVKEPDRGPLGRADSHVWHAVRAAVPAHVPVSVALGELGEWLGSPRLAPDDLAGIRYRKLGLAGAGTAWAKRWRDHGGPPAGLPAWIAVIYADWRQAQAPSPHAVLDWAVEFGCAGVLIDTWDKSRATRLDLSWSNLVERARARRLRVVLAGGLDEDSIARLQPLRPDLFAVRGAACRAGDRRGSIDPGRVASLVRAAAGVSPAVRADHAAAVVPGTASDARTESAAS